MIIDTHAHVNFNAFKNDSDEVIKKSLAGGVWMINVGSQYDTSERAVRMAGNYTEGVYAAIGLHPIHLESGIVKGKIDEEEIEFKTREEVFDYEKYKNLVFKNGERNKKVVAIGEVGFDYWYSPKTKVKMAEFRERQRLTFLSQLDLAKELGLPVMIHCRLAHDELLRSLGEKIKEWGGNSIGGVSHCFLGTVEQAKEYIRLGFHISFNGLIYRKIVGLPDPDEIIKELPLDKILVETDCPYLTPPQKEGERNEPLYIRYTVEKIAEIKKISFEDASGATTNNARELFGI